MSDSQIPFHETGQQQVYGVSSDCLYNDHPMCRSPRCGCSCHRQKRVAEDRAGVDSRMADKSSTGVATGLDKYCPLCKVKAASEQNYCTVDGTKLSSLRCPECSTPGEQSHIYCGYCGCSMKMTEAQIEAAATGNRVAVTTDNSPVATISDEEAVRVMRDAMANKPKAVNKVPAPVKPSVNARMFK